MLGGIFGITIGASIISAAELLYFLSGKFLMLFFKKPTQPEIPVMPLKGPALYWRELPRKTRKMHI